MSGWRGVTRRPRQAWVVRHASRASLKPDYELFNCNNFNIHYWSWNYRGCWHQTFPPIVTHQWV